MSTRLHPDFALLPGRRRRKLAKGNPRKLERFAIMEGISARTRVERLLEDRVGERTAELTAALEAAKREATVRNELISIAGHDLRTPLTVIVGLSDLARSENADVRQCNYLDKIVDAGKHLSGTIGTLLDLSRIRPAGRMETVTACFSLREAIRRSQALVAPNAAEVKLQLVERIDDQVPDALLGDAARLRQLLGNLLAYAFKSADKGGIDLHVSLADRQGERICLDIEVAIGGGPEEDIEQLLKPLAEIDASLARKHGAIGLGLVVSRYLAESMDGQIAVTDRAGSGTVFKVSVWLGAGADDDQPADAEALAQCRNTHVLVVEDQPINREVVEQLLLAVGIEVHAARDGREALSMLEEVGPVGFDLVLMDIQMPGMDGFEATRAIRAKPGFGKVPIIAMTAHSAEDEKQNRIAAGMDDHIGKPFETEDFYRILARWLPRNKTQEFLALPPPSAMGGLPVLDGIDTHAGLVRMAGNEARYRHWLASFVGEAPGYAVQIRAALADGHREKARTAAHAVAGRAGMLGMNDLAAIAAELEATLRRLEPVDDLLDRLQSSIGRTCDELQKVFAAGEGADYVFQSRTQDR